MLRPYIIPRLKMTTYARRLGLFSGTMAVVGGIIGGGIFRTPATVAERLHSTSLVLLAWVIGGVAVTFADYTLALLGLPHSYSVSLAVAAIVFHTGINYVGVRPAAITQNIFTILKLVALAALIGAGILLTIRTASYRPLPPSTAGVGALGAALVPVLIPYGGWQQTNFIAEEIVEPERNLPRALVLGV